MTVLAAYDALVASGELRPDPAQAAVAADLDALAQDLATPRPKPSLVATGWAVPKPLPPRAACTCGGASGAASLC